MLARLRNVICCAITLTLSSSVIAAEDPVSQATIDTMVRNCLAKPVGQSVSPIWRQAYCACMGREVPKSLTNTDVQGMWNAEKRKEAESKGLVIHDEKMQTLIVQCTKEAHDKLGQSQPN